VQSLQPKQMVHNYGKSQHENHSRSKTRLPDYHDSAAIVTNSAFYTNCLSFSDSIHKNNVVSILPEIFWRQQIGWNYCAGSRRISLGACSNTKKKVTLSRKRCPAHGAMVRCYSCYANDLQFNSRLADFCFLFFFAFSRLRLGVTFGG